MAELVKPRRYYDGLRDHPDKAVQLFHWEPPPKRVVSPAEYLRYFTFFGWRYSSAKIPSKVTKGHAMPTDVFAWIQEEDFPKEREFFTWRKQNSKMFIAEDVPPIAKVGYRDKPEKMTPIVHTRDYLVAKDYWDACEELDRGDAGKKAQDLLKEFLSEKQIREWEKDGHFWESKMHTELICQDDGSEILEITCVANLLFVMRPDVHIYIEGKHGSCWHPEDPIPSADLALIHLLEFREDPRGYADQVNY